MPANCTSGRRQKRQTSNSNSGNPDREALDRTRSTPRLAPAGPGTRQPFADQPVADRMPAPRQHAQLTAVTVLIPVADRHDVKWAFVEQHDRRFRALIPCSNSQSHIGSEISGVSMSAIRIFTPLEPDGVTVDHGRYSMAWDTPQRRAMADGRPADVRATMKIADDQSTADSRAASVMSRAPRWLRM